MSSKAANLCTQSHGYKGRKRLKDWFANEAFEDTAEVDSYLSKGEEEELKKMSHA